MLRKIVLFGVMLLSLSTVGCSDSDLEEITLESTEAAEVQEEDLTEIYVYVCGAVAKPGVYELQEGSRVFEAVKAAGGFTKDAAEEAVNQAEILQDEITLYIPTAEEVLSQTEAEDGKININQATKSELMELPGVGEAKALQIIAYREQHGEFQQIEDIMLISGIKEGLFEKIKEYITV